MLQQAFIMFDTDGDGKLTEAEVVAILTRKTGRRSEFSEEAARATWKRWQADYDVDNDGKISIDELKRRAFIIRDERVHKMRNDFILEHRNDRE